MTLERRCKLLGRGWGIDDGVEERVAVTACEHHALMFIEHSTSAFVGEISRCQSSDGHGALDKLLGRSGNAQLNTLSFWFTIDGRFAA